MSPLALVLSPREEHFQAPQPVCYRAHTQSKRSPMCTEGPEPSTRQAEVPSQPGSRPGDAPPDVVVFVNP